MTASQQTKQANGTEKQKCSLCGKKKTWELKCEHGEYCKKCAADHFRRMHEGRQG